MNEEDFSIENKLKELRKERSLSQEELAEAIGISRQSVIAFEQGKWLPSLPIAVSMCKFFDRAFEEIFRLGQEIEDEVNNSLNHGIVIKVSRSADEALGKETNMMSEMEPWRPFRESISLRDAVDRLLSDSVITPRAVGAAMPKIDIKERKEDVVIKAELPGIAEEDVDVEVSSDGYVTISGERQEEKKEEEEGYYYRESHIGSFSRSFSLPSEVVADKAEADMENGILTVTVPKARPEKTQKLKITAKKAEKSTK